MLRENETKELINIHDKELEKTLKIYELIADFSKKVFGITEKEFLKGIIGLDYQDDYGYYMIIKCDSDYNIIKFSKDPMIAFKEIIINILFSHSTTDIVEYSLDKWFKYYDGKIPKDIINYYENYLNKSALNKIKSF